MENNNIQAEDVLQYVLSKVNPICDKYKSLNLCNVGGGKECSANRPWHNTGTGCCTDCEYVDKNTGCTIVNLCCITYFCNELKHKITSEDWKTLRSTRLVLHGVGLNASESWDVQIETINKNIEQYQLDMVDLYNIFKTIYNHEK